MVDACGLVTIHDEGRTWIRVIEAANIDRLHGGDSCTQVEVVYPETLEVELVDLAECPCERKGFRGPRVYRFACGRAIMLWHLKNGSNWRFQMHAGEENENAMQNSGRWRAREWRTVKTE